MQNKLQLATPLLPQEVQQQGISVEKSSSSFLLVAGFISDNPTTTGTISLTMSPPMSKILLAASTAWAMCSCSARNTPCASGWMATC
nr:Acriflavine resistance protein B [Klebsiella pneumoniae]